MEKIQDSELSWQWRVLVSIYLDECKTSDDIQRIKNNVISEKEELQTKMEKIEAMISWLENAEAECNKKLQMVQSS